jgi:hypothetical protein
MKKGLLTFLQIAIVIIAVAVLAFLIREPQTEGVNANATLSQIYFHDPFLAFVYASSLLFFVSLYQAFKALGFVKQNQMYSPATVKAMQTIKYCSIVLIGCIAGVEVFLRVNMSKSDDIAGAAMLGFMLIVIFAAVAFTAAKFEQTLKMKSRTA